MLQVITMLISMSKLMSGFVFVLVLFVSDDASVHVCIHERTSNSIVTEEGAKGMRRGRRGRRGGGQLNCTDDSTFVFPNRYWRVIRLSASRRICPWRSSSNLRVLVAMVQYNMSDDCIGEVTRGSLPCLVSELPRVVKRVVPGPSIRQRIVKTHDIVETRSTSSWRPFGCCLPTRTNHVICLIIGSSFPNHEGRSWSATSSWIRVFIYEIDRKFF